MAVETDAAEWDKVSLERLLAETGLMAAGYGLSEQAPAILEAVHDLDPSSAVPDIGYAFLLLGANRQDEAVELLRRARDRVGAKDRAAVSAMLGWFLQRSGRPAESRDVLERAAAATPEEGPAGLIRAMLSPTAD